MPRRMRASPSSGARPHRSAGRARRGRPRVRGPAGVRPGPAQASLGGGAAMTPSPVPAPSRPPLLSRLPAATGPAAAGPAAATDDQVLDAFLGHVAERGLDLYPAQEEAIV